MRGARGAPRDARAHPRRVADAAGACAGAVGAMDGLETSDEAAFVADDVSAIIKESIDSVLLNTVYNQHKSSQWVSEVVETSLKRLTGLGKPFKYVVTCVIMQKNGAGMHTASSCYWDNATDGSRTVRWENKTMYCIATVFGLAVVASNN